MRWCSDIAKLMKTVLRCTRLGSCCSFTSPGAVRSSLSPQPVGLPMWAEAGLGPSLHVTGAERLLSSRSLGWGHRGATQQEAKVRTLMDKDGEAAGR